MKTKRFIYAILFALTFVLFQNLFAQEEAPDTWGGDNFGSLHIPTSTPEDGQFLRALFIFVTFSDDNAPNVNNSIWDIPYPNPTRPMNPYTQGNNIVASDEQSSSIHHLGRYEQYTISDFFCQMSGGQLDFIGDEVYFQLPQPSTYYHNTLHWARPDLNSYILQYVNDNLGVDFMRYDNWHKVGNSWVWGGDEEAEMIVIQFRKIPDNYESYYWGQAGVGGEAHLFGNSTYSKTLDGILIGNDDGIAATQGINRTTHLELVLEHEISHHIFGEAFDHIGFNPWHVSIGMMTEAHGTSTYCMIPMERAMTGLNWVTPMIANPNQSSQTFTLRDEFEYGDILKVPVPKANINDPQEYFWVTNHQKKSRYDGISRGSNTCYQTNNYEMDPFCDVGKGLFVFHESDIFCNNNINGYGKHYAFDLKSASGRWNWAWDTLVDVFGGFNIQKIINRNIVSGYYKFNKYYLRSYPDWSAQLLNRDPCWNPPNYKVTADFHGDGKDPFNMNYNELLSPYSNSASNNYQNPGFNTGVTIKLLSTNPTTGEMQVKVYYDDNLALYECPPAKPQNLKVTGSFVVPNVSFHPHLQWEANLEPDMMEDAYYKIYRGLSFDCSVEPTYTYIASVPYDITEYTDEGALLYTGSQGYLDCGNNLRTYSYKVSAVDNSPTFYESIKSERGFVQGYQTGCIAGTQDYFISNTGKPKEYNLKQNYPNPFNPITNINYEIPNDVFVSIKVYDILGREIKTLINEYKTAGSYIISFNGSEFSSGIYFYKIKAGNYVNVKRMLLIK
jgi:hypothetical protein